MDMLEHGNLPEKLRHMGVGELEELCKELREFIIKSVARTGGHLSSNLGTVELTVALLHVFDLGVDKIVWDVGHQAYAYKILTGRKKAFATLRKSGGLSGFLERTESSHDHFGAGHASTSISAALGILTGQAMAEKKGRVLAVIGDAALGGGMAFEALNHVGELQSPLIVILNDNEMSISTSVGGLNTYLSRLLTRRTLFRLRHGTKRWIERRSVWMRRVWEAVGNLSHFGVDRGDYFFSSLGFQYLGPVDGHNVGSLVGVLKNIRPLCEKPILLHVVTKKGYGYPPALEAPEKYHGIGAPGASAQKLDMSHVMGLFLTHMAERNKRIVAITAAMVTGTGLSVFLERFPKRLFDVGIAEEHAVTFAGGLAVTGFKPFVAIYATFLQRAFDQVVHDIVLQHLPVVFMIDRGGFVGPDGKTHQGIFDLGFLQLLPEVVIGVPENPEELMRLMKTAESYDKGPFFIRYPKQLISSFPDMDAVKAAPLGKGRIVVRGKDVAVLVLGPFVNVLRTLLPKMREAGIVPTIVDMRFLQPFDNQLLEELSRDHGKFISIAEWVGGMEREVRRCLPEEGYPYLSIAVPSAFYGHGLREEQLTWAGIDAEGILRQILQFCMS